MKSSKPSENWHTKKWYKENYGVDPQQIGLTYKETKNPYYSSAPPMKLWKEEDVKPYKNSRAVKQYKKRSARGKKAFQTRKENLKNFFVDVKSQNPRVNEITKRLWEIGEQINKIHAEKERCREGEGDDYDKSEYFDCGIEHCQNCSKLSEEQNNLREERYNLFAELEKICGWDKRKIQLARKYLREEKENETNDNQADEGTDFQP